jgi:uncharacterized membrane protein YhhN
LAAAVLAAVAHLAALALGAAPTAAGVTKPLPALALAAAALAPPRSRYGRRIGAGLLLSAAGDLLLEWPSLFLAGLAAFLLAHVAYAAAFVVVERRPRIRRALPFALWLGLTASWLWPGLGSTKGAVVAYMSAIGAMMWRAAAMVEPGRAPAAWALAGALLFAASDTLIAVHRFHAPVPGVELPIMALYFAGQLGIARSALE